MKPSLSELEDRYSNLLDDELLQIHIDSELTETAKIALATEMKNRRLTEQDITNTKKYNDFIVDEQNKQTQKSVNREIKRTIYIWVACIIFAIIGYTLGFIE